MAVFSQDQQQFIISMGLKLDFDNLLDDDFVEIEKIVGEYLVQHCLDTDYNPTNEAQMCYSILDRL